MFFVVRSFEFRRLFWGVSGISGDVCVEMFGCVVVYGGIGDCGYVIIVFF